MQYYCSHCGLVDKPSKLLRQHCRPPMSDGDEVEGRKGKCPGTPVNGYVLKNKYNQMVPESFLMAMVAGDSPLRRLQPDLLLVPQTIPPPPPPSPPTPVGVQQHIAAATPPTSSTLSPPKKRIKVSPHQLSEVTSPQYIPPTGRHRIVMEQIRLLDHVGAENHYDFFLHICLGTGNLTQRLLAMALTYRTPFDPDRDDPHLKLVLRAADLWFVSQSANIDVKLMSANMRAALYRVGTNVDNDDSDLLGGKTFVPTNDLQHVKKEVKYFLQFLFREGHVHQDLLAALHQIYESVPYNDRDPDSSNDEIATRIIGTNLLPAILINPILDGPKKANGPTCVHDYIAARTMKAVDDTTVIIRGANDISRSANALLRVIRHALCHHIQNEANDFNADQQPNPNDRWSLYAWDKIREVQQATSISIICVRIRSGKFIEEKTAARLNKMVEINTGDLYIAGVYIPWTRWSRAIPLAIDCVKESIQLLYPNQDALLKWCDVNNKIVMTHDSNTHVLVQQDDGIEMEKITLEDLVPMLGNSATDDVREAIQRCFEFECFLCAYMGVGAARGTEVVNMPEFDTFQFLFNCLRFQLLSRKGEKHGVFKNKMCDHYLSPE